ncbi:hypothetical protein GDO86_008265 [Hymenochirus boettgeri]|uniref:Secreted protein n=1 Tax=Hymenochirus boettgeri TaxID=247094 RepID=A0A8T2J488_9PIPI|nr:hypothetical protein GDO86_008265 [Hymenochirus boettgeri]
MKMFTPFMLPKDLLFFCFYKVAFASQNKSAAISSLSPGPFTNRNSVFLSMRLLGEGNQMFNLQKKKIYRKKDESVISRLPQTRNKTVSTGAKEKV